MLRFGVLLFIEMSLTINLHNSLTEKSAQYFPVYYIQHFIFVIMYKLNIDAYICCRCPWKQIMNKKKCLKNSYFDFSVTR